MTARRPDPPLSRAGMSALFSKCRCYRYTLSREWIGGAGCAMFIGLNPSTADETQDDPTIRRCIGFAKAWGYSALLMTNLFAWRATDPAEMKLVSFPVGVSNDYHLTTMAGNVDVVVAAWGVHGTHLARDAQVRRLIPNLYHLGLTKGGHPKHPLYLRSSMTPTPWT